MKKCKLFVLAVLICTLILGMMPCVNVYAASVKLNEKSISLTVGKSKTLKLKNLKKGKKIKWTSSKKKVATVSSKGKVTAKKKGKAVITAQVGGKKYKCKVTVKNINYSIGNNNNNNNNSSNENPIKYGNIAGNVTYHYNQYKGYVPDTGAKIFVLDDSKIVGQDEADGAGNYTIQHIPVGTYTVLISSKECKSTDVLYGTEMDDFYNKYGTFLNVAGSIHREYKVNVYEKETTTVSHAFPYTDY